MASAIEHWVRWATMCLSVCFESMTLLSDTVALAECDILGVRVSPRAGLDTVPAPEVQLSTSIYT